MPTNLREQSPSFRLGARTTPTSFNAADSTRTFHEREEVRDDTVTQKRRSEWISEQNGRFQSTSPPPFQPQYDHHHGVASSVDIGGAHHHYHYQDVDNAWIAAQRATQQAIGTRSWSDQQARPVLHHAHSDTEVNPRFRTSYQDIAQQPRRAHHEGYVMIHPRSYSFEHHRSPQQSRGILLHSQATPPIRRYEAHHHRRHHHHSNIPLPPPPFASHHTSPSRPFVARDHPMQYETTYDRHYASNAENVTVARAPNVVRAPSSYREPQRRWNATAPTLPEDASHDSRIDQRTISVAHTNLAHSSASSLSSSREWHGSNATISDDVKPSPMTIEMKPSSHSDTSTSSQPTPMTIEMKPSGHSEASASSSLGATEDSVSTAEPTVEDAATRAIDSSAIYRPVVSEESPQSYQPAPAKRSRHAYDQSATSSLELLCAATLDLGPLQENASGCSCPRSHCIKLYCDCFKAGRRCSSKCSCTNCKNTVAESGINGQRTRAISNILARNPRAFTGGKKEEGATRKPGDLVCKCVKSRCLKVSNRSIRHCFHCLCCCLLVPHVLSSIPVRQLYCECFQKGKLCNEACSCVSCLNTQEESHVGGRRKMAVQQALEKRPDAFTKKPKAIGSGCACKNNRYVALYTYMNH